MKRHVLLLVSLAILFVSALAPSSLRAGLKAIPQTASVEEDPGNNRIFINEVVFAPAPGGYEWVELKNGGTAPARLSGYRLTDEDGNWYRIPVALPDVPVGAFVVVVFDGQGKAANDLDFGDNVATVHSAAGLTDIFEDGADQVALYRATYSVYLPLVLRSAGGPLVLTDGILTSNVVSFVAWGADPGTDSAGAVIAGVWAEGLYKDLRGIGMEPVQPVLLGRSLGLVPEGVAHLPDNWVSYQESEVTQGEENPVPGLPALSSAPPSTIDSATFAVGWPYVEGATAYHFQMDDDFSFGSPEYDLVLDGPAFVPASPVPDGQYYWRAAVVRGDQTSDWSMPAEVSSITLPGTQTGIREKPDQAAAAYDQSNCLWIPWQLQRKDTLMVCRAGDNETADVWDGKTEGTKNAPWDTWHPAGIVKEHGSRYCERASVSMLASYYRGHLSQDRIAFQDFRGWTDDLGHADVNVNVRTTLEWAKIIPYEVVWRKPTFEEVKTWINDLRPFISLIYPDTPFGHFRVVDGYREYRESDGDPIRQLVHLLDPGTTSDGRLGTRQRICRTPSWARLGLSERRTYYRTRTKTATVFLIPCRTPMATRWSISTSANAFTLIR